MVEEGDDEDASIDPPPRAQVRGGGVQTSPLLQLGAGCVPIKLRASDQDTQSKAVLSCTHDLTRRVFYAELETGQGGVDGQALTEATKGAITTLLDIAEACSSRKITLGLGPDLAGWSDLVCTLLYIGFQVVPQKTSAALPFRDAVLFLDFDLGPPAWPNHMSDHQATGTSDTSTSADDSASRLSIDSD